MKRNALIVFACTALGLFVSCVASPVPMPDPGIQGYQFPEGKDTLMAWANSGNAANIQLHGWGIWTSLTMPSGQSEFGMPNVPVYLTWLTPAEILKLPTAPLTADLVAEKLQATKRVFKLEVPHQFSHGGRQPFAISPQALEASAVAGGVQPDTVSLVTVGFSPAAEAWIQKNNLFSKKALQAFYDAGAGDIRSIPAFPVDAVATKPTYKLVKKANLIDGHIYKMPAWPGTPSVVTPTIRDHGFPEASWPGCVYVDIKNAGRSTAHGVDGNCKNGPKPDSTYGLGDFVSYLVTAENVSNFEGLVGHQPAVGDVVLLMAMHVTSREMDEWTWQTFFWTPQPDAPPLPSSAAIAKARPAQLKGAAAHYAMSIGYQTVAPNQPATGGKSVGAPVIVYNPYLEARFDAGVFDSPPTNPGVLAAGSTKPFMATVGIQSNCMTCHGNATFPPAGGQGPLNYSTDFYVSRDDPAFKGLLQLDFLWSILNNAK